MKIFINVNVINNYKLELVKFILNDYNYNNRKLFIIMGSMLCRFIQNDCKIIQKRTLHILMTILYMSSVVHNVSSSHHSINYGNKIVQTKYGPIRGIIVKTNPAVDAYLGIPYASPPVGSLRFMPPVTPSTWKNIRIADRFSAVCPQSVPIPPNGPEALLEVPRARLAQMRRLLPLLANQSEDCLYLNLYVPKTIGTSHFFNQPQRTSEFDDGIQNTNYSRQHNSYSHKTGSMKSDVNTERLPIILYIHGESYEWNSGNPYDGSVLAAHGNVIVVTINFRLGILGFLKTGGKGSAQGNFGLMDLVAGLHWLRENLPAFGGDPEKLTIMGHGTGAALANILVVSPVSSDLIRRAILFSGSALSPWAIQKDPLFVKRRVAEQTGCHGDLLSDDLAPCLRTKTLQELLSVKIDTPRFLPGFGPFIDGTVIVPSPSDSDATISLPLGSAIVSTSGIEFANFPTRDLIFGVTSIESYLDLSAQDLEFGFNETRRDRIVRTFVRNIFHYHLNEIYAVLKNEYTDWEKAIRNPMTSRDASLEFLSDGHTASPLIRMGYLHSLRGGRSYFMHFKHKSEEQEFPQRIGSVRGEEIPFCLGLPISPLFPYNYTKQDIKMSRTIVRYLSNFAKTGNPNRASMDVTDISSLYRSSTLSKLHISNSGSAGGSDSHLQSKQKTHDMPLVMKMALTLNKTEIPTTMKSKPSKRHATTIFLRRKRKTSDRFTNRRTHFSSKGFSSFHSNTYGTQNDENTDDDSSTDDESKISNENTYETNTKSDRLTSNEEILPFWDAYDSVNQLYLEIANKAEIRSHYRGHKLSMWLNLIPQLHKPVDLSELPMRHHHFPEDSAQYYDGIIRPQIMIKPTSSDTPAKQIETPKPTEATTTPTVVTILNNGNGQISTECLPNMTTLTTMATTLSENRQKNSTTMDLENLQSNSDINILRRLTNTQYQSYTTALMATIAVGCFLLILNILIFAGIYYQREKRANDTKKKEELQVTETCFSAPLSEKLTKDDINSSIVDKIQTTSVDYPKSLEFNSEISFGEYSCYDEKISQCKDKHEMIDISNDESPFKKLNWSTGNYQVVDMPSTASIEPKPRQLHIKICQSNNHSTSNETSCHSHKCINKKLNDKTIPINSSGLSASSINDIKSLGGSITYIEQCDQSTQAEQISLHENHNIQNSNSIITDDNQLSPGIPEPPPPPKSAQTFQTGILRQSNSSTSTPSANKKRVHIQEISV